VLLCRVPSPAYTQHTAACQPTQPNTPHFVTLSQTRQDLSQLTFLQLPSIGGSVRTTSQAVQAVAHLPALQVSVYTFWCACITAVLATQHKTVSSNGYRQSMTIEQRALCQHTAARPLCSLNS
jgi:hypothetical protein